MISGQVSACQLVEIYIERIHSLDENGSHLRSVLEINPDAISLPPPTTAPACCIDLINGDHEPGGSSQPTALSGYPVITVSADDTFELAGKYYIHGTCLQLTYAY